MTHAHEEDENELGVGAIKGLNIEEVARAEAAERKVEGWQPTHRHKKRGTEYAFLGYGKMKAKTWIAMVSDPNGGVGGSSFPAEGQEVAIYRGADGQLWTRPREEFDDGRFEAIKA